MNDVSVKPVKRKSMFLAVVLPWILAIVGGVLIAMGSEMEMPSIELMAAGAALFIIALVVIIIVWSGMVKGINEVCKADGKHLIPFICSCLLSVVTLGIYGLYYTYKMQKRMYDESERLNAGVKTKPVTVVVLTIVGMLVGICAIIACVMLIRSYNRLAAAYNGQDVYAQEEAAEQVSQQEVLPDLEQYELLEASASGIMKCVAGVEDGPVIRFDENRNGATLGRKQQMADVILVNPRISKAHCDVVFDEQRGLFYVRDKDSTNGTFLKKGETVKRLEAGVPAVIEEGDLLILPDNIVFAFEVVK